MSPAVLCLFILALVYPVYSCGGKGGGGGGGGQSNSCSGGASCTNNGKRSVRSSENTEIQDALLSFDVSLTEDLAEEISGFSSRQKSEFLRDLTKMNEAVEIEFENTIANQNDQISTKDELVRAITDKITRDFKDRSWYKRLQRFAGNKISKLLNKL